jgi:N-acetylmuramoyl-L-alanine amidase
MTRDRDVYLDLVERTRIAKEKNADIFVSVHLNSAPRKSARGSEVWIISPAGAEATARKLLSNRNRAARELGLDAPQSEDILHMLVDVNQQAMMRKSLFLAEEILRAMNRKDLPPVRSVKQKGFAVLKSIDMPSVLVEAAFLTNSKDAALVKNASGRQAIADAIAAGILSYLAKYPPPPEEDGRLLVHTVKKGDTLWAISRRYETTVASIRKVNKIGSSEVIHVGQELVVREGDGGH